MNNYKVKALINFNDYEGKDINNHNNAFVERKANVSEWFCNAERYLYLKECNAVELIEIEKVEEKKEEKPKEKVPVSTADAKEEKKSKKKNDKK